MEEGIVTPPTQPKETERDAAPCLPETAPLSGKGASASAATSTEVPQTLEEVLDNIRELCRQEQVAKGGSGQQVKKDAHRALREGYKKARECLKQELPELQTSSVYRHAFVAKHYNREDREKWGVAKLQTLASIQTRAHGKPLPGDPADHEVHITREDGSVVAKKFSDCSWRDLQSAAKRQREAHKDAGRVVDEGGKEAAPVSKRSSPALSRALAMLGLGVLVGFIGHLLSPAAPGFWIPVFSLVLVLAGTAELVRYFVAVRGHFFAAFKPGEETPPPPRQKAVRPHSSKPF